MRLVLFQFFFRLPKKNHNFINQTNQIYWYKGKFGRLGTGNERNCHTPHLVETMVGKKPRQVSCCGFHTAVLTEDGLLYTTGGGEHGQVSHESIIHCTSELPSHPC